MASRSTDAVSVCQKKEREVISPCQDIFFVFFSVEMDLLFYVHDLALAYELKKDVHGSKR